MATMERNSASPVPIAAISSARRAGASIIATGAAMATVQPEICECAKAS
jgi:hypothetical protein